MYALLSSGEKSIAALLIKTVGTEFVEDHRLDIRDGDAMKRIVSKTQPDCVFDLGAQPLVCQS